MSWWQKLREIVTGEGAAAGAEEPIVEEVGPARPQNPVFMPPPRPAPPPPTPRELDAQERWRAAVPACLAPFAGEMLADLDGVDFNRMRLALLEEYRRPDRLALALFGWYGQGSGSWESCPAYETVPEQLLWEMPFPHLVAALEENPLDPEHLLGAARFFSGDLFAGTRGDELPRLPKALREELLAAADVTEEAHKSQRIRAVFGL